MKNNRGTTLAELMVYMVIAILILGYIFRAMQDVAKNYVRGREVTKLQTNGRDAIALLARDIVNTGMKYYIKIDTIKNGSDTLEYLLSPIDYTADSLYFKGAYTSAYVDTAHAPSDSFASFFVWPGVVSDTLEIYKEEMARADSSKGVKSSKYFIANDTLMGVYRSFDNRNLVGGKLGWGTPDTMAIMGGAKSLQFQFSVDGGTWIDNPNTNNQRDQMKYIKVSLVVESHRTTSISSGTGTISSGDQTVTKSGDKIYRTYERVIPIFNNGVTD